MVHPLLGYVHKDLALGSLIMEVLQFSCLMLTTLLRWVRSLWGELDRTKLHGLWSNPQNLPPLFLLAQFLTKVVLSSKHYIKIIGPYIGSKPNFLWTLLWYLCIYIYIYRALQPFTQNLTKTLTLLSLGLPSLHVFFASFHLPPPSCMRVCCASYQLLLSSYTLYFPRLFFQLSFFFVHASFPTSTCYQHLDTLVIDQEGSRKHTKEAKDPSQGGFLEPTSSSSSLHRCFLGLFISNGVFLTFF